MPSGLAERGRSVGHAIGAGEARLERRARLRSWRSAVGVAGTPSELAERGWSAGYTEQRSAGHEIVNLIHGFVT